MNYCETCKFRVNEKCTSNKLDEVGPLDAGQAQDMLIYDYQEGGGFSVGPRFGCVHHEKKMSEISQDHQQMNVNYQQIKIIEPEADVPHRRQRVDAVRVRLRDPNRRAPARQPDRRTG